MFQLIAVILIVLVAAVYVGRKLLRQLKGHGCEGCDCAVKAEKSPQLIQVMLHKKGDRSSGSSK